MILFRICSNLQVIHAVNQLCIPGWIACYTLTIPGQTLANMKQTFYWIETLVVSQSLHAGIPACSSIISDDTWYRIGSMINCLTLTCVVTIRIVDKENYKYYTYTKLFTFRTKGLTSVHGQMSFRRTKTPELALIEIVRLGVCTVVRFCTGGFGRRAFTRQYCRR